MHPLHHCTWQSTTLARPAIKNMNSMIPHYHFLGPIDPGYVPEEKRKKKPYNLVKRPISDRIN